MVQLATWLNCGTQTHENKSLLLRILIKLKRETFWKTVFVSSAATSPLGSPSVNVCELLLPIRFWFFVSCVCVFVCFIVVYRHWFIHSHTLVQTQEKQMHFLCLSMTTLRPSAAYTRSLYESHCTRWIVCVCSNVVRYYTHGLPRDYRKMRSLYDTQMQAGGHVSNVL